MSKAFETSLDTKNFAIIDGYAKAVSVLSRSYTPLCSISGGSDSDIVLDIIHNVDEERKVKYFWIDTGLEYRATKEHLDYLEKKYASRLNTSRLASRFRLAVGNTVSRFSPNMSANRLFGCNYIISSGRTSHCLNFLKNIQTAKLLSNGGATLTTLRKTVLCR